LFSVTDNLSGSIFAVSDISGVPIFDVNSNGGSVFTGLVSGITPVAADNFVTKAYVDGTGGGTGPFLPLAGGTMSTTSRINFYNNTQYIHASSTNDLTLASGDDINFKSNYNRFYNGTTEYARLSGSTNSWLANGSGGKIGISTTNPVETLTVPGGEGVMLGFKRFYSDTGQVPAGIGSSYTLTANLNIEQGTTLTSQYQYKFYLTTTGTGTYNSSVYIVYRNSADNAWDVHRVSSTGLTSNHPELTVSSTSALIYNDHPNAYNVSYRVETSYSGQAKTSPQIFGSDYMWTRDNTDLYYMDGDVGIGVSNPVFKLDVAGAIQTTGSLRITTANPGVLFKETDITDKNWDIQVNNGNLKFYEVNDARSVFNEHVTFGAGGNVGIGFTSPQAAPLGSMKLSVDGDTYVSGYVGIGTTTPSNLLSLKGSGQNWSTSAAIKIWDSYNSKGWYVGSANNQTAGDFYIRSVAAEADYPVAADQQFTIKQTGNVGIGTINPTTTLDIRTDTGVLIKGATSSANGKLKFIPASGGRQYNFENDSSSFQIVDASAGSSRMYFHYNGNLGIGTTSPDFKLDVDGTFGVSDLPGNGSSTSVLVQDQTTTPLTVVNGDFATDTGWAKDAGWTISGGKANVSGAQTGTTYIYQGGILPNPSENIEYIIKYTVSNYSAGEFRINVGGYISSSPAQTANGTYEVKVTPTNSSSNTNIYIQANAAAIGSIDRISVNQVTAGTNQIKTRELGGGVFDDTWAVTPTDSDNIYNLNSGNVGIGTSTPNSKLDIQGTQGQLFSVTDDLSGDIFSVADISGVPLLNVNSNGTSYFDSDLGIGTTSPDGKLEVSSNSSLSSYVTQYTNDADGAELVLRTARGTQSSPIGYSNNDSAGRLLFQAYTSSGAFRDAASIESVMESCCANAYGGLRFNYMPDTAPYTLREGMSIKMNGDVLIPGDVGIGTTNPTAPLTIAGTGADGNAMLRLEATGGSQTFNWMTSTVYPNLQAGNTILHLFGKQQSTNNQAWIGFKYVSSASTSNTLSLGFYANNHLVNLEASGNLGIKTEDPQTRLALGSSQGSGIDFLYDSTNNYKHQIKNYWNSNTDSRMDFNIGRTSGQTPETIMSVGYGGNVGIGTKTPVCLLDVRDGTISGQIARFTAINPHVVIESSTAGNSVLHFKPNTTSSKSGQFKVTAGNGYNFKWTNDAAGTGETIYMDLDTSTTGGGDLTVKGDIIAYGAPSDKKYKENIKPIESALDKAMQLQGVTFDWKDSESILDIKEDIGFIAQDVEKVLPELVRDSGKGNLSLRYQGITPILLEAIKELKAEIEELKKQIK